MKVVVTDWRDSTKTKEQSLQDYVEEHLDGSDFERGSLETAQATARNVLTAFSRLVEVLAEKKVITTAEFSQIVHGYERELKVKK